jgi:hypothetical protein
VILINRWGYTWQELPRITFESCQKIKIVQFHTASDSFICGGINQDGFQNYFLAKLVVNSNGEKMNWEVTKFSLKEEDYNCYFPLSPNYSVDEIVFSELDLYDEEKPIINTIVGKKIFPNSPTFGYVDKSHLLLKNGNILNVDTKKEVKFIESISSSLIIENGEILYIDGCGNLFSTFFNSDRRKFIDRASYGYIPSLVCAVNNFAILSFPTCYEEARFSILNLENGEQDFLTTTSSEENYSSKIVINVTKYNSDFQNLLLSPEFDHLLPRDLRKIIFTFCHFLLVKKQSVQKPLFEKK